MSDVCRELEVLVSLRATGALSLDEARRVEAHLAGCPACAADAAAAEAVVSLARLPPPTEAERLPLRDLPARALRELHRSQDRSGRWKRIVAGVSVAAAAGAMVITPALLRHPGPQVAEPAATVAWQEPDLDTLWSSTDVLELDAASDASGEGMDAALAALDVGDGS